MRSPYFFIVKPKGERYSNMDGGVAVSSSIEDASATNRFAEVIATPLSYSGDIKKGDILVVHHNIFRYFNDIKGKRVSSNSFFKDDIFFVGDDQFFLYGRDGQWYSHADYCFIKPIPVRQGAILKAGSEEPLLGIVVYGNPLLEEQGVYIGDEVLFEPESEYTFHIEGEKLYRMRTKDIVAIC